MSWKMVKLCHARLIAGPELEIGYVQHKDRVTTKWLARVHPNHL